jgi:hypothetical protein
MLIWLPRLYSDLWTLFFTRLRSKLNDLQEASGGKRISINDFILKVLINSLKSAFQSPTMLTNVKGAFVHAFLSPSKVAAGH